MPQPPQFELSDAVSTHAPLHSVRPAPHAARHVQELHTEPVGQALPHAPQLPALDERLTHVPLQSV